MLSRAALDMIVEFGLTESNTCQGNDTAWASNQLLKCMQTLTIIEGNSRDAKGLERFLTFEDFAGKLPENGPVGGNLKLWFRKHVFTQTLMVITNDYVQLCFQNLNMCLRLLAQPILLGLSRLIQCCHAQCNGSHGYFAQHYPAIWNCRSIRESTSQVK